MRSPSARTLNFLRAQDCIAQSVEKWIAIPTHPGGGIRRDLFACIDILAIQGSKLLAVQSTSGSNHNARVLKSIAEPMLAQYLKTGNLFECWSWTKKGPRGKRKLWQVRVTQLTLVGGKVVIA
jgi:hypothetical protein